MADSDPKSSLASGAVTKIGSYRLLEPLGSGGMSSVFRAEHIDSGHVVALKILPRSLAKNPAMLQRFLREAKSAESLFDPHIVEIFDRGTEDGRYYLALEYVDGGDLHDLIRKQGPMSLHEAVDAIRSASLGLRHAAEKGLIHRDIKPANMLRTSDGRVKLTDLGLALQVADEDERVTRDGTTVGTVDYMAPEQARDSRATSIRSDMYSLGCAFYYLLAAQPPFPGGSLPEKLRRHASEPPPDVRALRPDAPEELADLVKRMMAKKPEHRFVDYDHLIDALNELPVESPDGPPTALFDDEDEPALTALIDEDDDLGQDAVLSALIDEDDKPPALTALIDEDDDLGQGAVLSALIDEDEGDAGAPLTALVDQDDEEGYTLGQPGRSGGEPGSTASSPTVPEAPGPGQRRQRPRPEPALEECDFSNLAALASHEAAEPAARPRRRRPEPTIPAPEPVPPGPDPQEPQFDDVDEDEAEAGPVARPLRRYRSGPTPTVVALRVALGILLVLFAGIVLSHLLTALTSTRPPGEVEEIGQPARSDQPAPKVTIRGHAAGPRWVEPPEPKDETRPAPAFSKAEIQAVGLSASEPAKAPETLSPVVVVRRAPSTVDRKHAESLRRALDALSGTVEIDDDGPFYENDLQIHGKHRIVRAGKGRRPVVVVRPRLPSARNRPALVVLDGSTLTVEGIDFVIRADDLPANQSAVFLLKGSDLTLRDCSITVDGQSEAPLAVVQVGQPGDPGPYKPSKVTFERTLVRGPGLTAARIAEGPADVRISRSAVLSGQAPALSAAGGGGHKRSIGLLGSVLSSSDSIIELAGSAAGPKATPLAVHALGTTFARIEGSKPSGLVVVREPASDGPGGPGVVWLGDRNRFFGWTDEKAGRRTETRFVSLGDLDAIRSLWPKSDSKSDRESAPWSPESQSGWVSPSELASRYPSLSGLLAHVASPFPNLRAWTLSAFKPMPVELDAPEPADSEGQRTQVLTLDASGKAGSGDLGAFLEKELRPDVDRVRVLVKGRGWHPCSPVRLPEGVSLDVEVSSSPGDPLVWRPRKDVSADALIDVRNADLNLSGAVFERDARAGLKAVVRVDQGRLTLSNCLLSAPGQVESGGGNLVSFRTDGTRPLVSGASQGHDWPVCSLKNCVLITGGNALSLEIGRGLASLTNCALASGSDAITLIPEPVARDRFSAELRMDRCTVASEVNFVRFGPWSGSASGPDRPWLVSSHACAFLDAYDRGRTPSSAALLRTDPLALDCGSMLWQSDHDAYDITHFVVRGSASPPPVSFPDVRRLWQNFWGPEHVREPIGEGYTPRFVADRLKPGKVKPSDLVLGPSSPRSGVPPTGADLSWMGLSASKGGSKK